VRSRGSLALEIVFGVAFAVAAIAGAAGFWGNDRSYYASFATDARLDRVRFHSHFPIDGVDQALSLDQIVRIDDATRAFVLCDQCFFDASFPAGIGSFYTQDEIAHLADVRAVFRFVRASGVGASLITIVAAFGLPRWRVRREMLVVIGAVVAFGALAAVAFEPLFLAFHEVFFPQGNFLFDPTRENLTLVYPEEYWLGVTLRVGATVVGLCLIVGGLVSLPIRSSAAARSNKGTVR